MWYTVSKCVKNGILFIFLFFYFVGTPVRQDHGNSFRLYEAPKRASALSYLQFLRNEIAESLPTGVNYELNARVNFIIFLKSKFLQK